MLFVQCAIVELAMFTILISLLERNLPKGLVEWFLIGAALVILIRWSIIY